MFESQWLLVGAEGLDGEARFTPEPGSHERLDVTYRNLPACPSEPYMPSVESLAPFFVRIYRYPRSDEEKPFWRRVAEASGDRTRHFLKSDGHLRRWMEEIARPSGKFDRDLERDLETCFAAGRGRPRGPFPGNSPADGLSSRTGLHETGADRRCSL